MNHTGRAQFVLFALAALSSTVAAQSPDLLPNGAYHLVNGPTVAEQFLFAAANQDRVDHQLRPLRLDVHLIDAAHNHASEMARHHTISHRFDGEEDLADRAGLSGASFSLITENVAEAPNSAEIHDLWMHSAGHRANLLDPNVDAVGIAVVRVGGEYYAVEDFAHTTERMSLMQQETAVSSLLAESGLHVLPPDDDARQTCRLNTGYAGNRRPWFVIRYTSSDIHHLPEELTSKIATGRFREAVTGACTAPRQGAFTSYSLAVLLYP